MGGVAEGLGPTISLVGVLAQGGEMVTRSAAGALAPWQTGATRHARRLAVIDASLTVRRAKSAISASEWSGVLQRRFSCLSVNSSAVWTFASEEGSSIRRAS